MSHYIRKTRTVYYIYVHYGHGWEHECTELTWRDARDQIKTYRANVPYPVKAVRKREKIEDTNEQ